MVEESKTEESSDKVVYISTHTNQRNNSHQAKVMSTSNLTYYGPAWNQKGKDNGGT